MTNVLTLPHVGGVRWPCPRKWKEAALTTYTIEGLLRNIAQRSSPYDVRDGGGSKATPYYVYPRGAATQHRPVHVSGKKQPLLRTRWRGLLLSTNVDRKATPSLVYVVRGWPSNPLLRIPTRGCYATSPPPYDVHDGGGCYAGGPPRPST